VSENASKTTAYRGTRILIPHANEAPFPESARPLLLVLPPPPAAAAALSSLGPLTEFRGVEFRRSMCPPSPLSPRLSPSCPTLREMGVKRVGEEVAASFRLNGGEGANFHGGQMIFMRD